MSKIEEFFKKKLEEMSFQIEDIKSELDKVENSDEIGFLDRGYRYDEYGMLFKYENEPDSNSLIDRAIFSPTAEHALEIDKIITTQRKIHSIARQLEPDWEPYWSDEHQIKCSLWFDHSTEEWFIDKSRCNNMSVQFSENIAEKMLHHANVLKTFD